MDFLRIKFQQMLPIESFHASRLRLGSMMYVAICVGSDPRRLVNLIDSWLVDYFVCDKMNTSIISCCFTLVFTNIAIEKETRIEKIYFLLKHGYIPNSSLLCLATLTWHPREGAA